NVGQILLVEDKHTLMQRMGEKRLIVQLAQPLARLPQELADKGVKLTREGLELVYAYHPQDGAAQVPELLRILDTEALSYTDLRTEQSSLEEIFVNLVE